MVINKEDEMFLDKVLNGVSFPYYFGLQKETEDFNDEEILAIIDENYSGYFFSMHGASKYILINNNLSYVIKVPFDGYWDPIVPEDYDWDSGEPFDDFDFIAFSEANRDNCDDNISPSDYCETEVRFYNCAKELGLEVFFAETQFYGIVGGKKVYVQEKVIPYSSAEEENISSPLAIKLSKKSHSQLPSDWIEAAITAYGEELTQSFIDFLVSEDSIAEIVMEDLHYENYGYRKDGTPCLLDYSGYAA